MNERELEYKEAIQRLAELFSNASAPPSCGRHKYFLEYQAGEPVFRLAETSIPRDEIDVALDEIMAELFGEPDGNEIVPEKLAELFPGSFKSRAAS
jgi:hypothetical protein